MCGIIGISSNKSVSSNIINSLNILGKKKVESIISKCDFNQQIESSTEQHQQHQEKISQEHQE